jgi:uncharacterized protein (TIGR02246 family)
MDTAKHQIEQLFAAMVEHWNRHDTQAYTALWTEDSDFVNVVGMHRSGRRELKAELDYLFADRFKNTRLRLLRHKVRLLAPGLALAHVWWEMSGDPGLPGVPMHAGYRRGVFTHVIQLTDRGWRFVASQNTDTLPIPDPLHAVEPALKDARA